MFTAFLLLHRNLAASATSEVGQIRSPQAYPEGLLETSVDPQIPDAISAVAIYGRSVPLAAVSRCSKLRILKPDLFEHLVGERNQVTRDYQPKRFGSLEIDE
jgi:hypothetical protein